MNKSQQPIIELKNISKSFHSEAILSDFNFTLHENKFVTILGPSGSGKTTIIKLIAGFETVERGEIILNGITVNNLPPNRREVNTVFQNYSLFPHMSVYENIAFGLRMKKKDQAYIDNAVEEVLKIIKMEKFADRKPDQLSGGQQQRVAVARAIVNKPLILLLDEPLSALDEKLRKQMQVELKQMQKDLGITFILVTHDQEEALSISDIVIVLNNGKIEQIGSPQEIYEFPVNSFVADFVGELNILDAEIEDRNGDLLTINVEGVYPYQIDLLHNSTSSEACGVTPVLESSRTKRTLRFCAPWVPSILLPEANYTGSLINNNDLKPKDKIKLLLRPENLKLVPIDNSIDNVTTSGKLKGRIAEVRYRGALLDYLIILDSGKRVIVTVFQNKEEEHLRYQPEMEVAIEWLAGREVITT